MELLKFEAKLYDYNNIPQLQKAEEVAHFCYISPERLIELAKGGFAPCVIVDGENYLFFKNDLLDWAKANLLKVNRGDKIRINLSFIAPNSAEPEDLPEALLPIASKLKNMDGIGDIACVYFLLRNRKIVYIGQSIALGGRICQHSKHKDFDQVVYLVCPKESLLEIETALIRKFKPEYNAASTQRDLNAADKWRLREVGFVNEV